MSAREVALRIAALYGWQPTTDPLQMGTIPEKSAWDVVHTIENLVERYANDAVLYAMDADRRQLCECCEAFMPIERIHGRWTHMVCGTRVECRAGKLRDMEAPQMKSARDGLPPDARTAQAAPTDGRNAGDCARDDIRDDCRCLECEERKRANAERSFKAWQERGL